MIWYKFKNLIYIIFELSKVRITVAVAFTTVTGYVLARNGYDTGFILPTVGIFLLACGSSVINQVQERGFDAKMARTSSRPIPTHKISIKKAILIAVVEIIAGSGLLFFSSGIPALLLGWLAIFWYNVIYISLKRKTPNAVITGAVIGSIPPLVGWVAASGTRFDFQWLMMAIFFFIWQVPHFYLQAVRYDEEYRSAGLPSLTARYTLRKIRVLVFIWIVLTALAASGFAFSRQYKTMTSSAVICMISLCLIALFSALLKPNEESFKADRYFMLINLYVLSVITVLVADPLLQQILGE